MVHHWGEELALTIHDSASARHMEVILVLVTVGIGLFFVVALIALEVVFRGHEVGQVWRSLCRAERALKKRFHEVRNITFSVQSNKKCTRRATSR